MSLKEKIRSQINAAIKERREVEKNVLRVVLGEVDSMEARNSKVFSDDEISKVIRKILQGVEEMLQYKKDDPKLLEEKNILNALLPQQLGVQELKNKLEAKLSEIKNAKSDGQATGIAMKFFKEEKLSVDGNLVATIVKELRS